MSSNTTVTPHVLYSRRAQEKRGSELQAGIRAELSPSSLNLTLSSLGGRLSARTMIKLFGTAGAANFMTARIPLLIEGVKRSISPLTYAPLLVNLNAGFSPFGIMLATEMPSARDLAGVSS